MRHNVTGSKFTLVKMILSGDHEQYSSGGMEHAAYTGSSSSPVTLAGNTFMEHNARNQPVSGFESVHPAFALPQIHVNPSLS